MKEMYSRKGEISTLLLLGTLAIIGVATLVTNTLNRAPQKTATQASGCFHLEGDVSPRGGGGYDTRIHFVSDGGDGDIQLQKNGQMVAGWNAWNLSVHGPRYTYESQWTGSPNSGTVTYTGIVANSAACPNVSATLTCTANGCGTGGGGTGGGTGGGNTGGGGGTNPSASWCCAADNICADSNVRTIFTNAEGGNETAGSARWRREHSIAIGGNGQSCEGAAPIPTATLRPITPVQPTLPPAGGGGGTGGGTGGGQQPTQPPAGGGGGQTPNATPTTRPTAVAGCPANRPLEAASYGEAVESCLDNGLAFGSYGRYGNKICYACGGPLSTPTPLPEPTSRLCPFDYPWNEPHIEGAAAKCNAMNNKVIGGSQIIENGSVCFYCKDRPTTVTPGTNPPPSNPGAQMCINYGESGNPEVQCNRAYEESCVNSESSTGRGTRYIRLNCPDAGDSSRSCQFRCKFAADIGTDNYSGSCSSPSSCIAEQETNTSVRFKISTRFPQTIFDSYEIVSVAVKVDGQAYPGPGFPARRSNVNPEFDVRLNRLPPRSIQLKAVVTVRNVTSGPENGVEEQWHSSTQNISSTNLGNNYFFEIEAQ